MALSDPYLYGIILISMTFRQMEELNEFLEEAVEPFTINDAMDSLRHIKRKKAAQIAKEISIYLNYQKAAFPLGPDRWISERGCFENAAFCILPGSIEIMNGILIPGHRCIPFAKPRFLPHEYVFYWKEEPIPVITTEGAPQEFYPYYSLFGEEFIPHYIMQDNDDNEAAYNQDRQEDPLEVSIHTLDMRAIYRESSFVPGDRFAVHIRDWKASVFDLTKVDKDAWKIEDLQSWLNEAERGFAESFRSLGPGSSTEEQIAFAYFYGGERMRTIPAYGLDEFLCEKTCGVGIAPYGVETRFWYVGKEIPDRESLEDSPIIVDRVEIEAIFMDIGVPLSEFAVDSYIQDSLFRKDTHISQIIDRIIPPALNIDKRSRNRITKYIAKSMKRERSEYSLFADRAIGPARQRSCELHTAVINLFAHLQRWDSKRSPLPMHTFVILSQIQRDVAIYLKKLYLFYEDIGEDQLKEMDDVLDSMIDTYETLKADIDESLKIHRLKQISVVKSHNSAATVSSWRMLQLGLVGTEIWRRIILPDTRSLQDLERMIRILFQWKDEASGGEFKKNEVLEKSEAPDSSESPTATHFGQFMLHHENAVDNQSFLSPTVALESLVAQGKEEFFYEYSGHWVVRILILSDSVPPQDGQIRCVSGEGSAPPSTIYGPLQYQRYLDSLGWQDAAKLQRSEGFDIDACNRLFARWFDS